MKLTKQIAIENGIVTASISVAELGNDTWTAEEELEQLKNYPKTIAYKDIDFTAKVKMEDSTPIIAESEDSDADEITIPVINKEFVLDDEFAASLVIDSEKVVPTEHVTTKEAMSQAMAIVYLAKMEEKIKTVLDAIKTAENDVEKTEDVVL